MHNSHVSVILVPNYAAVSSYYHPHPNIPNNTVDEIYNILSSSLHHISINNTSIKPVLEKFKSRKYTIICDFCASYKLIINKIEYQCIAFGYGFQRPIICKRFPHYIIKHDSTPEFPPIYLKFNPPISQHHHKRISTIVNTEGKYTDNISY